MFYGIISDTFCQHMLLIVPFLGERFNRIFLHRQNLDTIRYAKSMWDGISVEPFRFSDTGIGPVGRSYDLFDDGSLEWIQIPGHTIGLTGMALYGKTHLPQPCLVDGGTGINYSLGAGKEACLANFL